MNRDQSIDILKGIGIILVVLAHTGVGITSFIYLFHMAIFFIASGYCSSRKYTENLNGVFIFIKRKVKNLWLPYFAWSSICILLNNVYINLNIYTNSQEVVNSFIGGYGQISLHNYMSVKDMLLEIVKKFFFMGGSTEIGGTVWFLRALFIVSILYNSIEYVARCLFKEKTVLVQGIVSAIFLIIGYCTTTILKLDNIMQIPTAMSVYCLYYIGVLIKRFNNIIIKDIRLYILTVVGFITLLICNQLGEIGLGNNSYINPLYLIVCSISGWFFIYGISKFLTRIKYASKLLEYIGRHSISIMLFHFISFKLITLLQIGCYNEPIYRLASFPVLFSNFKWIILYTCIGVMLPLLLGLSFDKFRRLLLKR